MPPRGTRPGLVKHKVKQNQTILDIADQYNVSATDLLYSNPQLRYVRPSQVVNIPTQAAAGYAEYRPAGGELAPSPPPVITNPLLRSYAVTPPQPRAPQPTYGPRGQYGVPYAGNIQAAAQQGATRAPVTLRTPLPQAAAQGLGALANTLNLGSLTRTIQNAAQGFVQAFHIPTVNQTGYGAVGVPGGMGPERAQELRRVYEETGRLATPVQTSAERAATATEAATAAPELPPMNVPGRRGGRATTAPQGLYYYNEQGQLLPPGLGRAARVWQLILQGERPPIISPHAIEVLQAHRPDLDLSDETLTAAGYTKTAEGYWIRGDEIKPVPTFYDQSGGGGRLASSYGYPYYGGGYPYATYGGGGYVAQEQRGAAPQRAYDLPARFGLISWRI